MWRVFWIADHWAVWLQVDLPEKLVVGRTVRLHDAVMSFNDATAWHACLAQATHPTACRHDRTTAGMLNLLNMGISRGAIVTSYWVRDSPVQALHILNKVGPKWCEELQPIFHWLYTRSGTKEKLIPASLDLIGAEPLSLHLNMDRVDLQRPALATVQYQNF